VGYLWAIGDASSVLRANLIGLPLIAVVLLALLPVIGVEAVGFAWLASGIAESIILIRAARRRVDIAVMRHIASPVTCAVVAALVGWVGAAELGSTLLAAVVGATLAWLVYFLGLTAWRRSQLLDTIRLVSRGMRTALSLGQ
jgi:O-antigen/teichoic acid export membrane protein